MGWGEWDAERQLSLNTPPNQKSSISKLVISTTVSLKRCHLWNLLHCPESDRHCTGETFATLPLLGMYSYVNQSSWEPQGVIYYCFIMETQQNTSFYLYHTETHACKRARVRDVQPGIYLPFLNVRFCDPVSAIICCS